MPVYLVTTAHLEDTLWFRDTDDFRVGMNTIAVVKVKTEVSILAFILMSNHVHFVLECSKRNAESFINEFKRHYSRYLCNKYGLNEQLRGNGIDIRLLDDEESIERAIAYVHMNSVAANICLNPAQYPWCSAQCFFSEKIAKGIRMGTLKKRASLRLLRSKVLLPPYYLVGDDGYVLPESYVEIELVERIFRTPKRMNYFLNSSSKSKQRLESNEAIPAFRDQYILAGITDICMTLFHKNSMKELNPSEMTELLRQLKFRFTCNIHQLARVTGNTYESVVELLDSE